MNIDFETLQPGALMRWKIDLDGDLLIFVQLINEVFEGSTYKIVEFFDARTGISRILIDIDDFEIV
jgi:hypothetical protein